MVAADHAEGSGRAIGAIDGAIAKDDGGEGRRARRDRCAELAPFGRALAPVARAPRLLRDGQAAKPRQHPLGRQRQFAETHAGRVIDRIGDRRRARHGGGFAGAQRRLVLPVDQQHVDRRQFGKRKDRIGAPVATGDSRGFRKGHFLAQHPARRLQHVAVDLMGHAGSGLITIPVSWPTTTRLTVTSPVAAVDRDVGDPGGPGGADARPIAMHIARLGEAAPAQDLVFGGAARRRARRHPARSAVARTSVGRSLVVDVTEAITRRDRRPPRAASSSM